MCNSQVLINGTMAWAFDPADPSPATFLPELFMPFTAPQEGDVLTVACLVDPITRQPCPVRVVALHRVWQHDHHVLAVVVKRVPPPLST
jgi:hypothetical protein